MDQIQTDRFLSKIETTVQYPYSWAEPEDRQLVKDDQFPLLLFLHGAGERGEQTDLLLKHGPLKRVKEGWKNPFWIVAPQCPLSEWWEVRSLKAFLDYILQRNPIDRKRIYITGLSMGGFGTWKFAIEYPELPAAIVPICGGGEKNLAHKISHIPTWCFHGKNDRVIPISKSEEMVQALQKAGGQPKFTVYPEAEHDSWTQTYENNSLYDWLVQQSL